MRKNTLSQPGRTGVLWSTLKGACLSAALGIGLSPATATAQTTQSNPIVIENQQPGTSQWRLSAKGTDAVGQIKGYASATSVNKGGNITFYVSVNPAAQNYTIDVYRIGWYQGLGGRLMQSIGPLIGVQQPTCPTDATTGMIECQWAPAYTLATQTSWTSGIYLALLTNAQGLQNYIVFVVRDDSRVAALLYQQPVATYQAYNDYPFDSATGKSLYEFNSYGANTVTGGKRAVKVSFDRPYDDDGTGAAWGQSFFSWEVNFVRWMEKSGYDVTYSTDVDTHTDGARLLNYRGILSVGHDEYWSKPMFDAFVAARDAGVNLAFFGANAINWQVRFESSTTGVPNRVVVCYRDATLDPVADPSLKTVIWRDPPVNRPEQTLMGVQYANQVQFNQQTGLTVPYVVTNSENWVYAGTGFKDGDSVPGIVGYETDHLFTQYPQPNAVSATYTLLSNSPFTDVNNTSNYANSSVYQAPSGAWVFGAGTSSWSLALDNYGNGATLVDPRIQQTTANILDRFVQPSDFTLSASPSSATMAQGGSTKYSVTISPTGGFSGPVTLSVSAGLPSGASGSFDPNPATASSILSVSTDPSTPVGAYTLTIKGVSGTLTHTTTVTLVVNSAPDFSLSASPASRTVTQGGPTSYSVMISATGGFTGQVNLSLDGLPSGASGSFDPNPATASSTLSVMTSSSTPTGAFTLTITGVNGSLTRTTTLALVVNPSPPTAPSSLTATALSSSRIDLTWAASSGAVTNYQVERCQTTACSFAPIATASGTTYSDTTGLSASTSYTYRVRASGPGGLSAYSNTASATTLAPPPPTAPSSLTATALSSSRIDLAWAASSGAVTNYQVERCRTAACSFAPIATASGTTYSDTTGLSASTSYTYRVRASGPGGLSAYSNTASATTLAPPPPTAPSSLTATALSSSRIDLAWAASSGAVTNYQVERCQTTACSFAPIATASGTTYSDTTGLSASTSYTYRVRASGPGGLSAYSNTASATTLAPPPPTAPSSLTATALSSSRIDLAWAASSGAVTNY